MKNSTNTALDLQESFHHYTIKKATFTLLIKQKVREPLLQADLFIMHFPDCSNNSTHKTHWITVTPKHLTAIRHF